MKEIDKGGREDRDQKPRERGGWGREALMIPPTLKVNSSGFSAVKS